MTDLLESDLEPDDPGLVSTFALAPALALTGLALAVASVFSVGLLSGSTYSGFEAPGGQDFGARQLVPGTLIGAAFAGLIGLLCAYTWSRSRSNSERWVPPVAAAGVLLSGVSLVGRVVVAALEARGHQTGFGRI